MLIHMNELLGEAEEVDDCACGGGLGVHVEGQDWAVVAVHVESCPLTMPPRTLRLVDADATERCRGCGGPKLLDIGGSDDGGFESVASCPRCQPRPTIYGGGVA